MLTWPRLEFEVQVSCRVEGLPIRFEQFGVQGRRLILPGRGP